MKTKSIFLLAMLAGLGGCNNHPESSLIQVVQDYDVETLEPMVFHLKESNYEIGIVKNVGRQWKNTENMIMVANLKYGRAIFLKNVGSNVYPSETVEVFISCSIAR